MLKYASQATTSIQSEIQAAQVISLKLFGKAVIHLELEKPMERKMECIARMLSEDIKRQETLLGSTKKMLEKEHLVRISVENWMT